MKQVVSHGLTKALFLGLLAVALCWGGLPRATGQYRAASQGLPMVQPEDIVNLTGTFPPGASVVVFTVPFDKWFVLTDVEIEGDGQVEIRRGPGPGTTLRSGFLGDAFTPYRSSVGLAFSPGSTVVLDDILSGGFVAPIYALTGHLAEP